jgi:predicted nucleic acid-binding protein
VANDLLLDTGGLVSLPDRRQNRHEEFIAIFESWTGEVVSTEAVLTEVTHLLSRVRKGTGACPEFFLQDGAVLVPSSSSALARVKTLMRKHGNLPMDYADATLVVLAEDLDTSQILTSDSATSPFTDETEETVIRFALNSQHAVPECGPAHLPTTGGPDRR